MNLRCFVLLTLLSGLVSAAVADDYSAGLVAHYFQDSTNWGGNWPDSISVPSVSPDDWTFTEYKYSRIEPVVNHLFISNGWFTIRWVGYFDASGIEEDDAGEIDFDIDDGKVVPTKNYKLELSVLGAALEYGRYDMPVTLQIGIGDATYEPWGGYESATDGNVNDEDNPRTHVFADAFDEKTAITIKACSWKKRSGASGSKDRDWSTFLEVGSDENSNNFLALRDGDEVPDVEGFSGQNTVAAFVADYVEDGKIKLDAKQAIYLFELGTTDLGSSAADFQDCVVLITLTESEGEGSEEEEAEGNSRDAKDEESATFEYVFEIWADDGCRLTIDDKVLIDDWRPCSESSPEAVRVAAPVKLDDGAHRIVVEYFQGQSLIQDDEDPMTLYWSCEEREVVRQVVPSSHLWHKEEDKTMGSE